MTKYTIKSTNEEGVYYLVNGWNKYRAFWLGEKSVLSDMEYSKRFFFNKPSHAKASLTKLLKVMPEYSLGTFELVEL